MKITYLKSKISRIPFVPFLLLLLFIPIFYGCNKDKIEVSKGVYTDGGKGTSISTGTAIFNSNVGHKDVIVVTLQIVNKQVKQTIQSRGSAYFLNIAPGDYSYSLVYYGEKNIFDKNIGGGVSIDLGTGKVTNTVNNIGFNNPNNLIRKGTKNGILSIKANKTLTMTINFR